MARAIAMHVVFTSFPSPRLKNRQLPAMIAIALQGSNPCQHEFSLAV
jgi:hypothetical protein